MTKAEPIINELGNSKSKEHRKQDPAPTLIDHILQKLSRQQGGSGLAYCLLLLGPY